jgi:hypothetical protein
MKSKIAPRGAILLLETGKTLLPTVLAYPEPAVYSLPNAANGLDQGKTY